MQTCTLENRRHRRNRCLGHCYAKEALHKTITKVQDVCDEVSNAVDDSNETLQTLPSEWAKDEWHAILAIVSIVLVLFQCVCRCIPHSPRLI